MRPVPQSATSRDFRVYITAGEAYPEFERMFLNAREKITLAFRIFDPWTTLHSPEALEIGENWMDLIAHTLSRGVAIDLTISDFDPVLRPELHRGTWASVRAIAAAGELSTRPELLRVHASMHPARVGTLTSIALWPRTYLEIRKTAAEINHSKHVHIDRFMSEVPFLRRNLRKIRNKHSMHIEKVVSIILHPAAFLFIGFVPTARTYARQVTVRGHLNMRVRAAASKVVNF